MPIGKPTPLPPALLAKGYREVNGQVLRIDLPPQAAASRPGAVPPQHGELAQVLSLIQRLVKLHGWEGMYTYNPHGPDTGLHCVLVREVVLFAEVTPAGANLSRLQQRWLTALQRSGAVEVVWWTPQDSDAIHQRLSRPREAS